MRRTFLPTPTTTRTNKASRKQQKSVHLSAFCMFYMYNLFLQLHALRRLMQGTPEHPKAPLGNNFRPPQPLLHRPVRTNIDFRTKQTGKVCPSMYKDVHYKGNYFRFSCFCHLTFYPYTQHMSRNIHIYTYNRHIVKCMFNEYSSPS